MSSWNELEKLVESTYNPLAADDQAEVLRVIEVAQQQGYGSEHAANISIHCSILLQRVREQSVNEPAVIPTCTTDSILHDTWYGSLDGLTSDEKAIIEKTLADFGQKANWPEELSASQFKVFFEEIRVHNVRLLDLAPSRQELKKIYAELKGQVFRDMRVAQASQYQFNRTPRQATPVTPTTEPQKEETEPMQTETTKPSESFNSYLRSTYLKPTGEYRDNVTPTTILPELQKRFGKKVTLSKVYNAVHYIRKHQATSNTPKQKPPTVKKNTSKTKKASKRVTLPEVPQELKRKTSSKRKAAREVRETTAMSLQKARADAAFKARANAEFIATIKEVRELSVRVSATLTKLKYCAEAVGVDIKNIGNALTALEHFESFFPTSKT